MASITVIVGEAPYGRERVYTSLRFVLAALHEGHAVNLFLFEDAVFTAKKGQKPAEFPALLDAKMPNCEELLGAAIRGGAKVKLCGVCAMERALSHAEVVNGAEIGSIRDLVQWVVESDRIVRL